MGWSRKHYIEQDDEELKRQNLFIHSHRQNQTIGVACLYINGVRVSEFGRLKLERNYEKRQRGVEDGLGVIRHK